MSIKNKIAQWAATLNSLSSMDRLEYIIELGNRVEPLEEKYRLDVFKIQGCASNLWLVPIFEKDVLRLRTDADAFITKGTAYIVLDILNDQRYNDIKKIETEDFVPLGMSAILTPQRQNGLGSLITTIRRYAGTR